MKNLGGEFARQARDAWDRPALWSRGDILSYGELLRRAGSIALTLDGHDLVGPGDRVAILADRTPTAYAGLLAALVSGAAYVPLNARFPVARNRSILEKAGARVLICDERHRALLPELASGLPTLRSVVLPESDAPGDLPGVRQLTRDEHVPFERSATLPCERNSGDLAYVFFTSGSTGEPKGVPITHANVFAYLDGIRTVCEIGESDRVLQLVDLTFDLSVHDMFLAWLSGACLYSVPENAVLLCTRFVAEHDVTAWLSVPSTAGLIKQAGLLEANGMPTLRYTFFCGEALAGGVAEAWAEAAPSSAILNIYGPTEATVAFSAYRYQPGQESPPAVVPLGEPFPGQRMALFSPEGTKLDSGVGEICLSGSQVMDGYWNAPELTEARFLHSDGHRWYRTGDLGQYQPGQGFLYAGRTDHQVKIRGYRVEMQEIEAVVRRATGCDLVAALPWPVTQGTPATACIAFALDADEQAEAAQIEACRKLVPEYMVPTRIFSVDSMPFNSNGKVDYGALRAHPRLAELASGARA